MKKLLIVLLTICLLTATVSARTGYLEDKADLLTNAEASALEDLLEEISTRQGVDIVIVTVNSTDGDSMMDYADDFYDYNEYREDGILLLVNMDEEDRSCYISTAGYGITAFTDAGMDYMYDQFLPDLGEGKYVQSFETFANLCDEFITQAKTGDPYDRHNLPKDPFNVIINLLVALGLGLIAALVVTLHMKGQLKTVRPQMQADAYMRAGSLKLTQSRDLFLYAHTSRHPRSQSSSGSGGSTTHTSSSGTTHGGSGRKF